MVDSVPGTSDRSAPTHPRTIGWIGTTALAMGGSNQSLFLIGALMLAQGSAAVPLLVLGLLLSWAAAPGWTELVLMWPNRVGGIAATCAEAFRPYSPVLANLTGVCYWWGWVPTCGVTAILSAAAIQQWYLPAGAASSTGNMHSTSFYFCQFVRYTLGGPTCHSLRNHFSYAGLCLWSGAYRDGQCQLAPGTQFPTDQPVPRFLWRPDQCDGRPVP